MRAYLTYEEYTKKGGSLDASSFNRHMYRATMIINQTTFNRITEKVIEDVENKNKIENLTFELVEFYGNNRDYITSKSAGVVSESYDISKLTNFADDLIEEFLGDVLDEKGTKLTYLGL